MANEKKQRKNTKRPASGPRPDATSKPAAAPAKKGVTAPKGAPTAKRGTKNEVAKDRASWAVLYAGIAVVVIVIGFAVFSAVRESRAGTAEAEGWVVPALGGGDDVALADFEGKPVVLNFFASWCTACEAELPEYDAAADRHGDAVEFVFINSQDDGNGMEMARQFGIDDNILVRDFGANDAAVFRALRGQGMPITAFYEADGSLRWVSQGALVGGRLEEVLREFGWT